MMKHIVPLTTRSARYEHPLETKRTHLATEGDYSFTHITPKL